MPGVARRRAVSLRVRRAPGRRRPSCSRCVMLALLDRRDRHRRLPDLARRRGQRAARQRRRRRGVHRPRAAAAARARARCSSARALGISGAVFQSLTRNPLGSPDIVGFPQGADGGALIVITILGGLRAARSPSARSPAARSPRSPSTCWRSSAAGRRATGSCCRHRDQRADDLVTDYLLTRARIEDAQEATRWLLGSLNGRTLGRRRAAASIALVVLLPLASPPPGARCARSSSATTPRTRSACASSARGSALVGARRSRSCRSTTVAVGPIGFVALTAPQIARRLTRTAGPPLRLLGADGRGARARADIAAQRLVPDRRCPWASMTGAFGGLYLAWLLRTRVAEGTRMSAARRCARER